MEKTKKETTTIKEVEQMKMPGKKAIAIGIIIIFGLSTLAMVMM